MCHHLGRASALQVFEHHSPLGRWRFAQRPADPRLRDYVHGFVVSEGYLPTAIAEWHVPSLEVAVVLNFASPHRLLDCSNPKRATEFRSGWVAGLQTRHRITEAVGDRDFLVIRFTPIGAHLFLKTPMNLLADDTIDLEDIEAPFARFFMNAVGAARDWDRRLDRAERLVGERLASARSPSSALIQSWRRILQEPNLDLSVLSSDSGCSRRHLIAQFNAQCGLGPKTIARIRRFNLAVAAMHRSGGKAVQHAPGKPYLEFPGDSVRIDKPWAQVALDCGYYDQSHFINEFRAFAGMTPGESV